MKLTERVEHARLSHNMSADELVGAMSGCAFGAGRLASAADIYEEMVRDNDCTKFFGLAGAMVPAGMRSIVSELLRDGYIDVLVTTGANLVHDIIESLGLRHFRGTPDVDDVALRADGVNRIYDVFLPEQHFTAFEEKMQSVFSGIGKERLSIRELLSRIGEHIDDRDSILRSAYEKGVPVYCPALADSIIGLQAWLYAQKQPLQLDAIADMREFIDGCFEAKRTGAFIVGGGVPKNFIFQAMLVTPKEFDYAIQLTMDRPEPGGLSGATLEEARSWGKVGADAKSVTVYSDATITMPLIVASVRARLGR